MGDCEVADDREDNREICIRKGRRGRYSPTGAVTHSATTTRAAISTAPLILRGMTYVFPSAQGSASSTLVNNGSGTLVWSTPPYCAGFGATSSPATASDVQATTDGFLTAYVTGGSASNTVTIQVGAATTTYQTICSDGSSAAVAVSCSVAIKRNLFYKITVSTTGGASSTYWQPIQ